MSSKGSGIRKRAREGFARADVRAVVNKLVSLGWTVEMPYGKGKPKMISPDGASKMTLPITPSNHRWIYGLRTQIKHAGYPEHAKEV